MNDRRLDEFPISIYREAGVVAIRTADGFSIFVPCPDSFLHQITIAGALWDVWDTIQCQLAASDDECIVDVSALDELPRPVILILSAMDACLNPLGRQLRIVGGNT